MHVWPHPPHSHTNELPFEEQRNLCLARQQYELSLELGICVAIDIAMNCNIYIYLHELLPGKTNELDVIKMNFI